MKNLTLVIAFLSTTTLFAQDMSFEYQFSTPTQEHYVINFPKDSTYLRWGIWLNALETEYSIHTMKMFMTEDEALFLDQFQGVAQIELENDEMIPINVFTVEDTVNKFGDFDKILAFQFNDKEADVLMEKGIKRVVFYTTYGKFSARFANRNLLQNALATLKYNVEIFNEVQRQLMSDSYMNEAVTLFR